MRTVRDATGDTYILVKQADDSWLVRDPATGAEQYRPATDLTPIGTPPLDTAASAVPTPIREVISGVGSDVALGLLVELTDRGPTAVRTLLDMVELCESDLYGHLAELRTAGLVTETQVDGRPGYTPTDPTREAVSALRRLGEGEPPR